MRGLSHLVFGSANGSLRSPTTRAGQGMSAQIDRWSNRHFLLRRVMTSIYAYGIGFPGAHWYPRTRWAGVSRTHCRQIGVPGDGHRPCHPWRDRVTSQELASISSNNTITRSSISSLIRRTSASDLPSGSSSAQSRTSTSSPTSPTSRVEQPIVAT